MVDVSRTGLSLKLVQSVTGRFFRNCDLRGSDQFLRNRAGNHANSAPWRFSAQLSIPSTARSSYFTL